MPKFDEVKQDARVAGLRKKEEEELAQMLSSRYGVAYIDLSSVSINTDALKLIPEDKARLGLVAAFHMVGDKVHVAIHSPQKKDAQYAIAELERQGKKVILYMASTASLERAWDRYEEISHLTREKKGVVDVSDDFITGLLNNIKTIDDLRAEMKKTLTTKDVLTTDILEVILAGGIALTSSDIHIEPEADGVRTRLRLDGVLQDLTPIDPVSFKLLLSRIKLVSGLKLNVHLVAQDGRFTINTQKTDIEIRSSVIPGAYGESAVLRILDPKLIRNSVADLGVDDHLLSVIKREISKPNGMVLTTGPTGSGKTTTLYAFINEIYNPGVKVITIENPVEYKLEGIVQTQVDEKRDYTFFNGLRSALRQDPDVIMVGEIRDPETARTAINSALTGHLVFSTLHTNNAAGTIPRLIDLGVNPKIISSALNLTLAQRLIRVLCKICKKEHEQSAEERVLIDKIIVGIQDREVVNHGKIWKAEGCPECNHTGYNGRIGVYEGIIIDKEVESIISKKPSERDIWDASKHQKIMNMKEDGVLKVLTGVTDLAELKRALGLSEYD